MDAPVKTFPSERWSSFTCCGSDEEEASLRGFIESVNKPALIEHALDILGVTMTISEPFSIGQSWCCLELVAPDRESFIIARLQVSQDPEGTSDLSNSYAIECEVATMAYVRDNVEGVTVPKVYAYEGPGSAGAAKVGAVYMLIEGFFGNTAADVELQLYNLPIATQQHFIAQWTSIQASLASHTFPQIGSIRHYTPSTGPIIGPLSSATSFTTAGPFTSAHAYFTALAASILTKALSGPHPYRPAILGALIFRAIVRDTPLFRDDGPGPFPLNHMDLGIQNLLIDPATYDILAVIDWEMAHAAPWLTYASYPMPFPSYHSDRETAARLHDPAHVAHVNVARQLGSQRLYRRGFLDAERRLRGQGWPLGRSIAAGLEGDDAGRVLFVAEKLGHWSMDKQLTYELVRVGFGLEGEAAREYARGVEAEFQKELEGGGGTWNGQPEVEREV
ncbi:hypothetical protein B0H67DRAFT_490749 [Lasiosphaeris hirsuta]|uniref:Aminoglycoside phosphotransferase domain-containing protein n=1 Tax=Lasiosphaeris hirsuta TaxID=260670 RepID=A0AA40AF59_9PEZI|nr:hypothetical protein B0H67DRAFT_490749 [Lasiosphaeris hirsuta]